MKEKRIEFSFSDENPGRGGMMLLSEVPYRLGYDEPIVLNGQSGKVLYLDFYPRNRTAHVAKFQVTYSEDTELLSLFQRLISGEEPQAEESLIRLREGSRKAVERATNIISAIENTIKQIFVDSGVNINGAYDQTDVKTIKKKGERSITDRITLIEQNTKLFIKSNKIFAGLAYLKDVVGRLAFGFGFHKGNYQTSGPGYVTKVIFYPSHFCWRYKLDNNIDRAGIQINKVIECFILLVSGLNSSAPLVSFYRELNEKASLNLKSDVLIRLVEALVQHNEISLLGSATERLKALEPHHPLIGEAAKAIRRANAFSDIRGGVGKSVSSIQDLTGIEFEQFLADQFQRYGFTVTLTKASGDYGADLVVETASGTRAAIQAKRFKSRVNLKAVQEVGTAIKHYAADFGIVIAASGFLPSAIELARTNQIELWDDDKVYRFINGDWSFSLLAE